MRGGQLGVKSEIGNLPATMRVALWAGSQIGNPYSCFINNVAL
jgi:hypothetical protein